MLTIFDFKCVLHFAFALILVSLLQRFDKCQIMRFRLNGIGLIILLSRPALRQPLKRCKFHNGGILDTATIQKYVTIKFIFENKNVILIAKIDVSTTGGMLTKRPIGWHKVKIIIVRHRFNVFDELFFGHCWRQMTHHNLLRMIQCTPCYHVCVSNEHKNSYIYLQQWFDFFFSISTISARFRGRR